MRMGSPVIVFNRHGRPIVEYPSIEKVAEVYEVCPETIRKYINSGKLYTRAMVFFDWGEGEGKDGLPA